jgi:hypothetical protein
MMTEGERLAASGYRAVSNKYRMIARLDRPDWLEHMARQYTPWSFEEGMRWATGLGEGAADHYRRVYSKDVLENISIEDYNTVRRSGGASHGWGRLTEYLPVIEKVEAPQ